MAQFKQIVRAIVMAQVASDAGKHVHNVHLHRDHHPHAEGYKSKDFYILRAVRMIDSAPPCGINYRAEEAPDQNGYNSVLIYFDIRYNGERYQVSFHNPPTAELKKICGKGRKTRWTGEIGGSRRACQDLIQLLNL